MGFAEKYEFPEGDFADKRNSTIFNQGKKPYRTVSDAISDLPELKNNETKDAYEVEALTEYQRIMRGENLSFDIVKPEKLFNHTAPNHQEDTIKKNCRYKTWRAYV